ncbi:Homocysteine synthase [Lachnellula suecica]|uniref:Homocysteine synthase n=1 Tax=Lachnellula suecica TaxID=602035 RepID=A0A8T9BTP5_9HELO|nr:Homocysteine synthase [Lachnellula suecica]
MSNETEPKSPVFQFETSGVHAGLTRADNNVKDAPIYASTSFVFNDSAQGAAIFNMTAEAFCYSRIANPTVDVFEKRMATLENGAAALVSSSGQSALFMTVTALAQTGENIVVASHLSDTSAQLFKYRLPPSKITARFVESGEIDLVRKAIDENTKAVFVESISSHGLLVADIAALAIVAHEAGVPLVVDNTAGAGGFLLRPIDHGADIVIASASEWLSISGSNSAGIIVDSGKFDWSKSRERFPQFFEPAAGFHGLNLWEKFGSTVFIAFTRIAILRDIGPCLNPFEAFQLLAGLETLSVRVERSSSNAAKLAAWLKTMNKVGEVQYPGLKSNPLYQLSEKYLKRGYGGLLSFTTKDGTKLSKQAFDQFKLVSVGRSIGGSRTVVIEGEREEAHAGSNLIYVSLGLENIDDIIADFKLALSTI